MNITDLKNRKIGIFGFGTEGEALLEYFKTHQIGNVSVFDENDQTEPKKQKIKSAGATLVIGEFKKENCKGIQIAFRSPGLKLQRIKSVLDSGCDISSPTNLFFALHKGRVVAVTGTKGKSTTVGLIAKILELEKIPHFVGGNIGNPPINFVDKTTEQTISVLELSSFQLEDLEYAPDTAIILPLYTDHLDYHESQGQSFNFHESQQDYYEAKAQIVAHMSKNDLIIAHHSEHVKSFVDKSVARKIFFCEKSISDGCYISGNNVECVDGKDKAVFSTILSYCTKLKIPSVNVLAAMTFAFSNKISFVAEDLFRDFEKLPFRIQLVSKIQNLVFYNDSASTNPVSTIQAMRTMSQKYALIMGGSSKNLSFDALAQAASQDKNIAIVYLIGQTGDEIEDELKLADYNGQIVRKENLEAVMDDIRANHRLFSAVLFSPASASFDQYGNYKERGEHFNKLVKNVF